MFLFASWWHTSTFRVLTTGGSSAQAISSATYVEELRVRALQAEISSWPPQGRRNIRGSSPDLCLTHPLRGGLTIAFYTFAQHNPYTGGTERKGASF